MSLTNEIFTLLREKDTYAQVQKFLTRLGSKDQTVYKPVCNAIILGLASKEKVTKLMAARLGKDAVEQKNTDFNEMFSELCLPYYETIAEFKKEVHNDQRGKYYYSETPNREERQYGISILQLTLESIEVWAKFYPCQRDGLAQSAFFKTYTRLLEKEVKFPDKKVYFRNYEVDKNTHSMFTKLFQSFSEMQRDNTLYKENQANYQGEMHEAQIMSTPEKENQKIIYSEVQSLIDESNLLKGQHIIDLKQVNQNLKELIYKIDIKIEEFLNQGDVNTSLELLKLSDEIKILSDYKKLQKDKLIQQLKRKKIIDDQIEQQHLDIKRKSDSLSSSSEDHETPKNPFTDQITALKSQIEQLQSLHQNDNLEMEKMRSQICELKKENEMMKQEIETLKTQQQIEKNQLNNQIQQQKEIIY